MAQLRGDTTVGGKPVVTLDVMNEFVEQIHGVGLRAKVNKFEDDAITDFNTADVLIKDTDKNGFWQVDSGINNDGKYNCGQLANLSNKSARFQLYAPHNEKNISALYVRTGWDNDIRPWERITTHSVLTEELNKKFDKTGGDISGTVTIGQELNVNGFTNNGPAAWLKNGVKFGTSKACGISLTSSDGLDIYTNSTHLIIEDNAFKYKNYNVWHSGNLTPNDYVSRTADLLSASTDLNTILTTGYYRCNTPVNAPSKITSWAYIEVVKHSDTNVLQKIYSFDGLHVYSRTLNGGGWTTWRSLGGVLSATRDITAANWSSSDGIYEMTVTHNIGSENITSVIVTDSNKMSMFTGFQVISPTVLKVFSTTNPAGKIVINAIQ